MFVDPMGGRGFGSQAGHCGLARFGHTARSCKNQSCGRQTPNLFNGFCVECAASAGVPIINLNNPLDGKFEPSKPPAGGCS